MVLTASLMAPKALATSGSLISTSAVTRVTASPIAVCRNDTARRFSPSAHAIASNASTPNADCSCSMIPKPPRAIMAAADLQAQCRAARRWRPLTSEAGVGHGVINNNCSGAGNGSRFDKQETGLTMSSLMPVGAGALLRHPSFLLFLLSRSFSRFSSQIGAVAIGWQVYDLTGSAFDLGMIGLVQFLPTALLVFVAGHAADRYERKRVVQICQIAEALTALFLAWGAYAGSLTVTQIFIATVVLGTAGAFESPALAALLPLIAPQGSLQRATAISSGAAQIATITGPALGGLAYAIAPSAAYGIMAAFCLFGRRADGRDPPDAAGRGAGIPRRRTISLPASDSSATIRPSSARSRSICSPCCSAAPPRCCRSMRATSSRPARSASASCAPRPRSARC